MAAQVGKTCLLQCALHHTALAATMTRPSAVSHSSPQPAVPAHRPPGHLRSQQIVGPADVGGLRYVVHQCCLGDGVGELVDGWQWGVIASRLDGGRVFAV